MIGIVILLITGCSANSGSRFRHHNSGPTLVRDFDALAYPSPAPFHPSSDAEMERRIKALANYATGVVHDSNLQPEEAMDRYTKALENDPSNTGLLMDVVRGRLQRNEFDRAVDILKKAVAQPDAPLEVWSYLALTQLQLNRPDETVETYRASISRFPDYLSLRTSLAQVLLDQKRGAEAFRVLDDAADMDHRDPRRWIQLAGNYGWLARRVPELAEAAKARSQQALEKALAIPSEDPQVLQFIGDGYVEIGKQVEAEKTYRDLRERFPAFSPSTARLAELYLRGGRMKEAAAELEQLRQKEPSNPLHSYFLGLIAAEEKKFDRSAELFRESIQIKPGFEPAHLDLAGALLSQGQAVEALDVLDKARSHFKPSFRMEYLSGLSAMKLERWEQGEKFLAAAEVLGKKDTPSLIDERFYFQLGLIAEKRGDREGAERYMWKVLEIKPNEPDALNHIGYTWAEEGRNLEKALEMIRQAVNQEPENEAFLDSLAWVLFKLGRGAEALIPMEKSIQLSDPPDPTLFDHLGDIRQSLGNREAAEEAWRKAIELKPDPAIERKLKSPEKP